MSLIKYILIIFLIFPNTSKSDPLSAWMLLEGVVAGVTLLTDELTKMKKKEKEARCKKKIQAINKDS